MNQPVLLHHYYLDLYSTPSPLILLITDNESHDYIHDITSDIVYPPIPPSTHIPMRFSTGSAMSDRLIDLGTSYDLPSLLSLYPEYFI